MMISAGRMLRMPRNANSTNVDSASIRRVANITMARKEVAVMKASAIRMDPVRKKLLSAMPITRKMGVNK